MADAIGISGIHNVSGNCDLCGRGVDALSEELNALDCTYQDCPPLVYHQDCLEKYLKSIRLEKNRKTGFKCPRGCGKGTTSTDACPGKIDKSHPIHPRSDFGKKRKKAKPPPEPPHRAKPVLKKEKKDKDKTQRQVDSKADKAEKSSKGRSVVVVKALNVSNPSLVKPLKAEGVARSASLNCDTLGVNCDPRKSFSSVSSCAYSSTNSGGNGRDSQDFGMRTSSMPLFSPWSKPVVAASTPQVPDINSLTAFPPTLSGSVSEDSRVSVRSAPQTGISPNQNSNQSCWSTASKPQPVPKNSRGLSANDGGLQLQHQSLPNSSLGSGDFPVGMDYCDVTSEAKLTKAQKKNMKRAERKKKTALVDAPLLSRSSSTTAPSVTPKSDTPGSQTPAPPSDDSSIRAANDHEAGFVLSDLFLETLVAWKTLQHIRQLQLLGFEGWQSAAAVKRFGSNMECAIAWLLDVDMENDEHSLLHSRCEVPPEVNISTELSYIRDVQDVLALPESVFQQAVVDCDGDLDAAVSTVVGSHIIEAQNLQLKGSSSMPLSQDVSTETGLPFSMSVGSDQVTGGSVASFEGSARREHMPSGSVVSQIGWPDTISEQLMLGGVLGSKLEEYKRGNANFTSLANKEQTCAIRPSTPSDSNLLGIGRGSVEGSPSSGLDFLARDLLNRNMSPRDPGRGDIDVEQYNRLLSGEVNLRNPMQCAGGALGGLGGMTSNWNLNQVPMVYSGVPVGGDVQQEEQQDWQHLIGNLLLEG